MIVPVNAPGVRCYLSGPMTGIADHNFPAFAQAAKILRGKGWDILSAHEIPHSGEPGSQSWSTYLRGDLNELLKCDAIVLLPGWANSRGARLELHVARELGMRTYIYFVDGTVRDF